MKSKTLVILGIGTYILSVLSSAEDLAGNYTAPTALIAVSGIATIAFVVLATIRLWKGARDISIMLVSSEVILTILTVIQEATLPKYGSPIIILLNFTKIANFVIFFYVIFLLWAMAKQENKVIDTLKNSYGLTPEESSLLLEEKRKGNEKSVEKILASAQERAKAKYKEATGIDPQNIVPEIGKEISWADIVNDTFRVFEFDRNGTIVNENNQVKAKGSFQPYGYLMAESPILNNRVKIPIIHRDDFLLAASVFDDPKLSNLIESEELLVVYAPKHLGPKGISSSPHHVLHYALVPSGTLDSYYSANNDAHFAKPEPQKLFGSFVYEDEIKVQINSGIKSKNIKRVNIKDIQTGPTKHDVLPDELIVRIQRFKKILAEVETTTLEQSIDNFKRDAHPENEVEAWEAIAILYKRFTDSHPDLELQQKKEVFSYFLRRSMGEEKDKTDHIKNLTEQQIKDLTQGNY